MPNYCHGVVKKFMNITVNNPAWGSNPPPKNTAISKRIAYILHAPVDEPAGRGVKIYMEKFKDVDIILPKGKLPPFPRSIDEVNAEYMRTVYLPLVEPLLLDTIKETKKLNYGAICTASFGDVGLSPPREGEACPVIGLGWSNFQEALSDYGPFSLIHPYTTEIIGYFDQLLERYHLSKSCVSIEVYDENLSAYLKIGPEQDMKKLIDLTLPCVERGVQKGAKAVLVGCGGQFWSRFAPRLSELTLQRFGVPVLPPIDTMLHYARKRISGIRKEQPESEPNES